jgi:hypothetical protein
MNFWIVIGIFLIIKIVIILFTWEYIAAWLCIIKEIYE